MARTALWAPAHRVMQRMPLGSGVTAQNPDSAPSMDLAGAGIQDPRLLWNTANSSTAAQVVGWYLDGPHPVLDFVPATLTVTAIAASQTPTAGTAMTLVSATGAGVTVSSSATLMLPSLTSIPSGSLFLDSIPVYRRFGQRNYTVCYDAATMGSRNVVIHSAGDDTLATFSVVGWDMYGYVQHETLTGANAGNATGLKAFKAIASITPSGTLGATAVTVGQGDTYGIPFYVAGASAVTGFYNNLIITGAGTVTAGDTATATATTGDVRGTYLVGSASNATKRMIMFVHPSLTAMVTNVSTGLFGVAPF